MRMMKKFLTAMCTAGLLFSLMVIGVSAEEYTYTVTFDAGNQASMSGTAGLAVNNSGTGSSYEVRTDAGKIVVSGLRAQDIVTFNPHGGAVALDGASKYYIKGVRQSGRDNNSVASSSFRVTGDADYVVAYGLKGNMVGYTVNYQDENGKSLAESRKYYGNVGDKPVVAHVYIENYIPQALALTRTLSANEAENVFTFVYAKRQVQVITRPGQTVTETITETIVQPSTTTPGTTGSSGTAGSTEQPGNSDSENTAAQQETPEAADTTEAPDTVEAPEEPSITETPDTAETTAETASATEKPVEIQEEEVPQASSDIVDLDEEKTPLANIQIDKEEVEKGMPLAVGTGIAVVAVIGLGALIWFLKKNKK